MTITLTSITLDCDDAQAVATFWSAALGRTVNDGASREFASIGYGRGSETPAWLFLRVPEGKSAKNRMHVDLTATDREAEVERLVGLGAQRVGDVAEWGHKWTVLQDPEGNEFCVAEQQASA
ncbi:VOC family protein [Pseudonocardia sp. GCM10023141]|uniref:VOC family protein n=1 Tax=Pseudonocardia sp. GCM10023141 TaxID=3252653 RepID=UPI00360E71E8